MQDISIRPESSKKIKSFDVYARKGEQAVPGITHNDFSAREALSFTFCVPTTHRSRSKACRMHSFLIPQLHQFFQSLYWFHSFPIISSTSSSWADL